MPNKTNQIRMEWRGERAVIYVYDEILETNSNRWDEEGVTPEDVRDLLQTIQNDREMELHINSPGGSVWGGVAIYNLLKQHTGKITGYVDGVAASAASVILMAADEIIMPTGAFVMIHAPSVLMYGNAAELRARADELDKIGAGIADIYQRRLINQEESALEMMLQETWFTGEEFQAKFSGVTVEEQAPVYACLGLREQKYKHTPEKAIFGQGLAINNWSMSQKCIPENVTGFTASLCAERKNENTTFNLPDGDSITLSDLLQKISLVTEMERKMEEQKQLREIEEELSQLQQELKQS